MRQPNIEEALTAKLGRPPTFEELRNEVRRIGELRARLAVMKSARPGKHNR